MEKEDRILRFIDGTATGDECRELIRELHDEGTLGEVLASDAATLFLYSREELLEYLSPEEVDEIEEMRDAYLNANSSRGYSLGDEAGDLPLVAEDEASYGE